MTCPSCAQKLETDRANELDERIARLVRDCPRLPRRILLDALARGSSPANIRLAYRLACEQLNHHGETEGDVA